MPIDATEPPCQIWTQYNLRQWSKKCRVKYQESSTSLHEVFRSYKCKHSELNVKLAEAYVELYLDSVNANLS